MGITKAQEHLYSLLFLLVIMWISPATTSAFSVRLGGFLSRSSSKRLSPNSRPSTSFFKSETLAICRFRTLCTGAGDDDIIDPQHCKSYHLQGTSTSPTPFSPQKDAKGRPRRRRGSGPGVTLHTVHTNHVLQTDVPKAMGGDNLAPQPVETLLAALIGCTQATALFVGRQSGVIIDKMEFDLQAARDERGALQLPIEVAPDFVSRLQEISGTIKIYSPELLSDEALTVLREQTEVRCPVANMMLASGCQMNVEWKSLVSEEQE